MKYSTILALDPSGSFYEGKGVTGWCVMSVRTKGILEIGSLRAKNYSSMEEYWNAILRLIQDKSFMFPNLIVVCEDYILYAHKADSQINSRMETCKLIGCIQLLCYQKKIPYHMQLAAEVKQRWNNDVLVFKKYITKEGRGFKPVAIHSYDFTHHCIDAIRHAIHYIMFKNK